MEIAAVGGHNSLMIGPPGAGKSMLAERMTSILPEISVAEVLSITMIHSINGTLPEQGLISNRPFRDPHHSASMVSLIGGGRKSKSREVSLAHNGVLFLDELPEIQRSVLDSLRQPFEAGETSAQIRTRVKNASVQQSFKHEKQAQINAKLSADSDFELTDEANELLHKSIIY